MSKNQTIINESIIAIENCHSTLSNIAETCCSDDRSPNMIKALSLLTDIAATIKDIEYNSKNINLCIKSVGIVGSQLGFLYATCCTVVRKPLYQDLFTELMQVHSNMYLLSGHSH